MSFEADIETVRKRLVPGWAWKAGVESTYRSPSSDALDRLVAEHEKLREGVGRLRPLFSEFDDYSLRLSDERLDELQEAIIAAARALLDDTLGQA